jgi:hypothetical protein
MGITNGLDLSPDGGTLYYRLEGEKLIAPRLLKKIRGLRPRRATDRCREQNLRGAPLGRDRRDARTRWDSSTRNLPSRKRADEPYLRRRRRKTIFVTQRDGRFIETFRVDRPGREFVVNTYKERWGGGRWPTTSEPDEDATQMTARKYRFVVLEIQRSGSLTRTCSIYPAFLGGNPIDCECPGLGENEVPYNNERIERTSFLH